MNIRDFNNDDFINVINLYSAPYKIKNGESLAPIEILDIKRNSTEAIIKTSQIFMDKYIIKRSFKFSNNQDGISIKTEMIDHELSGNVVVYDASRYFTPIFMMISSNNKDKSVDWLSRFSMDDLYYFANKYVQTCSSINIETDTQFHNHCKDIFTKDENGYIISARSFGDYGINYAKHTHTLSKLNSPTLFQPEDLEFYKLMLTKLNNDEKIEYTNNFVNAHLESFINIKNNKSNFILNIDKCRNSAIKLLESLGDDQQTSL